MDGDMVQVLIGALLENSSRLGLTWTIRPATVVEGANPALVRVQIDGDDETTFATSMLGLLERDDRVFTVIIPKLGPYIIGWVGYTPGLRWAYAVELTDEAFTSTAYDPGTNICGVTFTAPGSGNILVMTFARYESNTAGVRALVSHRVGGGATIGGGSVVSASSNDRALTTPLDASGGGNQRIAGTVFSVVTGLIPGDTYNATVEHRMDAAGSGDIFNRAIFVLML